MRNTLLALLMMLLVVAIWGSASPIIKYTLEYIPPFTFLGLRFGINALILLPLTVYFVTISDYDLSDYLSILWLSFLGFGLAVGLGFLGLNYVSATFSVILGTTMPLVTMVFAYFLLNEKMGKLEVIGTLIAFFGALVVTVGPLYLNNQQFSLSTFGSILLILSMIFDALYLTYAKKLTKDKPKISSISLICLSITFAALMFIPLALFEQIALYNSKSEIADKALVQYNYCQINLNFDDEYICDQVGCYLKDQTSNYICIFEQIKENLSPNFIQFVNYNLDSYLQGYALLGLFFMIVLSGTIAYGLMQIALKSIDASEASLFSYLRPIFGVPLAFYLLNETIDHTMVIGAIIIIFGIIIAELYAKR